MSRPLLVACFILSLASVMNATPAAFPATEPDRFEIKLLPAGTLLEATAEGDYFSNSNRLFRPLFRYISDHGIAMTVPVETRSEPGAMYFWVAPAEVEKVSGDRDGVRVLELPPRQVASHGQRGGYSARNFAAARDALLAWLATQPDWEPVGEPYGVYWNGPFTPWFLKRFEVHVPVRPAVAAPRADRP